MPVVIQCPRCSKELAAPDELIGKVAACPRCNTQFPVTVNVRSSAPSLLAGPAAATPTSLSTTAPSTSSPAPARGPANAPPANSPDNSAANPPQPRSSKASNVKTLESVSMAYLVPPSGPSTAPTAASASTAAIATVPTNLPPSVGPATPPASSEIRRSASMLSPPAPVSTATPPAAPPALGSSAGTIAPGSSVSGSGVSGSVPREAQPARFIAAESTETRINLGADGRLPELVLHEASKHEVADTAERTSHPIRLLLILGASFVALVFVLTMDTGIARNESQTKAEARRELQDLYARRSQPHHPQKEYQRLLSKALQAHNQGKYAVEQGYYRQVLNMLRVEALQKDAANVKGLTGVRKGDVPSDEHLESLLSRLLSNH